MISHLFFS